jgi:hypothetical protein
MNKRWKSFLERRLVLEISQRLRVDIKATKKAVVAEVMKRSPQVMIKIEIVIVIDANAIVIGGIIDMGVTVVKSDQLGDVPVIENKNNAFFDIRKIIHLQQKTLNFMKFYLNYS